MVMNLLTQRSKGYNMLEPRDYKAFNYVIFPALGIILLGAALTGKGDSTGFICVLIGVLLIGISLIPLITRFFRQDKTSD